jgi:hypothetical protein
MAHDHLLINIRKLYDSFFLGLSTVFNQGVYFLVALCS